jgi:hypothetical protein
MMFLSYFKGRGNNTNHSNHRTGRARRRAGVRDNQRRGMHLKTLQTHIQARGLDAHRAQVLSNPHFMIIIVSKTIHAIIHLRINRRNIFYETSTSRIGPVTVCVVVLAVPCIISRTLIVLF